MPTLEYNPISYFFFYVFYFVFQNIARNVYRHELGHCPIVPFALLKKSFILIFTCEEAKVLDPHIYI